MTQPYDEIESSPTDRMIGEVLRQPLLPDVERRLRDKLVAIHLWVDGQPVPQPERRSSVARWGKNLVLTLAAAAVLVALPWIWRVATQPREAVNFEPPAPPTALRPAPVMPPDSATDVADVEDGYGTLVGQVVLQGAPPPASVPLMTAKLKDIATSPKCGPTVPDETLLIDPSSRGVANVFVYLVKPGAVHPSLKFSKPTPVVFNAACGRFIPHVLVIRTDQTVNARSLDPFSYNVHSYPLKNRGHNLIVDTTPAAITVPVVERAPFKIVDDIHPWMSAYWLVLDHSYAAITDKNGRFTIPKLPAGDCEFHIWHERAGYVQKSKAARIESRQTTDWGTITVTAGNFRS